MKTKIEDLLLRSYDVVTGESHGKDGVDYLFKRTGPKQVRIIRQEAYTKDVPQIMSLSEAKDTYEDLIGGGESGYYPHEVIFGDADRFFEEV